MRRGLFLFACSAAASVHAGSIALRVLDANGVPLEDAAGWATPRETPPLPAKVPTAAIEQVNKTFVPLVSVVQVGTSVRFPNRDETRHHVYSFSPAKRFEIKLYAGTAAPPIDFDKAGDVVLGCNIHDNMVGYVYVVDSPHFGKTGKDGRLRLDNLPPGDYEVHLRHFLELAPLSSHKVAVRGDESQAVEFTVPLKPRPRRPGATP
jgi:plastocyanin